MPTRDRRPWSLALLLATALAATAFSSDLSSARTTSSAAAPAATCAAAPREVAAGARPPCCFTNPAYAGVCVVEPAEGETCSSILDYLNTAQTSGKGYCDATLIRGGWRQAPCPKQAPE